MSYSRYCMVISNTKDKISKVYGQVMWIRRVHKNKLQNLKKILKYYLAVCCAELLNFPPYSIPFARSLLPPKWIANGGKLVRNIFSRLLFSRFFVDAAIFIAPSPPPNDIGRKLSALCAIMSALRKYRGIEKSISEIFALLAVWMLYRLTDSLYFSIVGVSS